MNPISRSTAFDVAKLSAVCLKDQRFRAIVNTKFYKVPKKGYGYTNSRSYKWENTHKMLGQKGITPIKTGITMSAGACLATACEFEPQVKLVVILLGCKDMDSRWLETQKLAKWATKRINRIKSYQGAGENTSHIL
jgi:D-alanyl-D-alanine carboxypeptidase